MDEKVNLTKEIMKIDKCSWCDSDYVIGIIYKSQKEITVTDLKYRNDYDFQPCLVFCSSKPFSLEDMEKYKELTKSDFEKLVPSKDEIQPLVYIIPDTQEESTIKSLSKEQFLIGKYFGVYFFESCYPDYFGFKFTGYDYSLKTTHLDVENPSFLKFQKYLFNEELSDCIIEISSQEIPVHKFILCSHSEYFSNLLENKNRIKIDEIDLNIFKLILEYIYTQQLDNVDPKQWVEIIKLSNEYKLEKLKEKSIFKFKLSLTLQDFFYFYEEYFMKQKMNYLKDVLVEFVVENFDDVVGLKKFAIIQKDILLAIIRRKVRVDSLAPNRKSKQLGLEIEESLLKCDDDELRICMESENDSDNASLGLDFGEDIDVGEMETPNPFDLIDSDEEKKTSSETSKTRDVYSDREISSENSESSEED
eukprot:gene2184-2048_t